jgi:hypothetical protein
MLTNIEAERAVLGAMLALPELFEQRASWLTEDMFTEPRHKVLFPAIVEACKTDEAVPEAMTVFNVLRESGAVGRDPSLPIYLADLTSVEVTANPINLRYYAQQVLDAYRRREMAADAERMLQVAETASLEDLAAHAAAFASKAADLTSPIDGKSAPVKGLHELGAFIDMQPATRDWVIPGLLTRGDRVIVVASEGAGKTMIARAIAVAVAMGRHPLDPTVPIPPKRTLLADLENPAHIIQDKTGVMVGYAQRHNLWTGGNAHILHRPGGLDLRKPPDQRELQRAIARTEPDIVCLGPIYKTFAAGTGEREENAAREVALFFDKLRERYGFALWLEHHAPLEQNGDRPMRPIGTSLWQRWPEFGIGLRKQKDKTGEPLKLDHWRGQRDEREWPSELARGSTNGWAWSAAWEKGQPAWMAQARKQLKEAS